ncbi:GNAT family N-acetyltransferase [Nonomuraea sp. NPDC002799]
MFDPEVNIVTERLTLRPFGPRDARRIRSIVKSGVQFLPPGAPARVSGIAQWLLRGVHELRRSGQGVHLAMIDADRLIVGSISLFKTSWSTGTAEVGYGVHPLYRGRGFATEAVRGLAGWAFGTIGLRRIDLTADVDNLASLRVAHKAGFTWEGVLRSAVMEGDVPHDVVVFGLLREDSGVPSSALPRTELRTPRLLLRPHVPADAPHLTAVWADPLTQAGWGTPREYTEGHARAYIGHAERMRIQGARVVWTIEEPGTGRYAGDLDLRDLDWEHRKAEIGYAIAPWARGMGYAGEAVTAVARWLFDQHGFRRLQLQVLVTNAASQRVAEKAGFVREGVARAGLDGRDAVVYSLVPSDLD